MSEASYQLIPESVAPLELINGNGSGPGIHLMPDDFKTPLVMSEAIFSEAVGGEGARRIATTLPNPTGSGRVRIEGATPEEFWGYVDLFQAVAVALDDPDRDNEVRFVPYDGLAVTYDVEAFHLTEMPQDRLAAQQHAVASYEFTARPYGRLDPVTIVTNANGSDPLLAFELPDIPGHVPALMEILCTDLASKDRWHAEYGIQFDYDPAAPTDLIIVANELDTTGLAGTGNTRSGAYFPSGSGSSVIRATLSPTAVAICSTGVQSSTGLIRPKWRLYADTALTYARIEWRIGDGPWNKGAWQLVLEDNWSERDMGLIDVPAGETWEARLVARCETAGGILDANYCEPWPADRYGKARRVLVIQTPPTLSLHDEYDQTAGALSGKTLPDSGGQTWATTGGATPDDYQVDAVSHRASRSSAGDSAGVQNGRFAIAGTTTFTDLVAQIAIESAESAALMRRGLFLRFVDLSNFAVAHTETVGSELRLYVQKRVAGVTTPLPYVALGEFGDALKRVLQIYADARGRLFAWLAASEQPFGEPMFWKDADLATGGALASGRLGAFDQAEMASGNPTRFYDDFAAWVPEPDAVCFSGQSLRFRHDIAQRENAAGTRWGRVPRFEGEYARCPPAGPDSRTYRGVVKLRCNDIDELPDDQVGDSVRVDVTGTPRVLLVSG